MDTFNISWIALVNECGKFCVSISDSLCNISESNVNDLDFNLPKNRINYMYNLCPIHILHFQQCIMNFKDTCSEGQDLFNKLCLRNQLNITSLSSGPGTDIIGFLNVFQNESHVKCALSLTAINKYGAWGGLLQEMIRVTLNSTSASSLYVPPDSKKLIMCDILSSVPIKYLKNSDVVFLVRAFATTKANIDQCKSSLKEIISSLKLGALVFFVDSKKKCNKFVGINNCGVFIHGPTEVKLENIQFNEIITNSIGSKPVQSSLGYFAVWQKTSLAKSDEKIGTIAGNLSLQCSPVTLKEDSFDKSNDNALQVLPNTTELRDEDSYEDVGSSYEAENPSSVSGSAADLEKPSSSNVVPKKKRCRGKKKKKSLNVKDGTQNGACLSPVVKPSKSTSVQGSLNGTPVMRAINKRINNGNLPEETREIRGKNVGRIDDNQMVPNSQFSTTKEECIVGFSNSTPKPVNRSENVTESLSGKTCTSIETAFNSFLKRCNDLITNLEKVVADIQDSATSNACSGETCSQTDTLHCKNLCCSFKCEANLKSSCCFKKCSCALHVHQYSHSSCCNHNCKHCLQCCQKNAYSHKVQNSCQETTTNVPLNHSRPYIIIPL